MLSNSRLMAVVWGWLVKADGLSCFQQSQHLLVVKGNDMN